MERITQQKRDRLGAFAKSSPEEIAAKKTKFLELYQELGIASHACTGARIDRRTLYDWLEKDEEFKQAMTEAKDDANDALELEARRRAFASSDTMLIFLMKGNMPEKYKERGYMELAGKDGGAIQVSFKRPAEEGAG